MVAVPTSEAVVVRVAVEAIADRPERTFTYRVPPELGVARPGALLLVPYGRRLALGYALEPSVAESDGQLRDEARGALKEITAIVSQPILPPDLLQLAEEMAAYYRAPLGMTIAAMLPPGLESRLERRWELVEPDQLPSAVVAAAAASPDGWLPDALLRRHAPRGRASAWLDRLRSLGAIRASWSLRGPEVGHRRVRVLRLQPGDLAPLRRAPLQRAIVEVLERFAADGRQEATLLEIADDLGSGQAGLLGPARRLAAAGQVALEWRTVQRDPLAHRPVSEPLRHALAPEQVAALETLERLAPGGELLLEGVAASGKSDVYLAAAQEVVDSGGGAILLVPEMSLVPQLADRAAAIFGDGLAVLHSGLSAGERHDEWWRILRGDARLVIGTRVATFAPVQDLALVIVDEEHDGGYKSDRTPRYDARWVGRQRAALSGARLVLGSATPDLVTVSRVRGGHADRARLVERRVGATPAVDVVDLRAELASGNRSVLSNALAAALDEIEVGTTQAVLLINRRGAASFILCRDCGESLRCPDCDLPFVFHLDGGVLRCHHCGRTATQPSRCPHCSSARIRYFGAGTQRVAAEVQGRFPRLRVGRLDSDVVAARRGFETVYDDFRDGRIDVLVGTQLAAKGLDLPAVTLAAVIAADVTLNLPDYRAAERTFQLLAQVAGRAGRGALPGSVVIQTYTPEHYAVRAAATRDVDAFADEELVRRRLLGYPPFSVLARLLVADADRGRAEARATEAATAVAAPSVEVLGPLPAYVPRRAGRWRFQVVIRASDEATRGAALERVPAGVAIDVDPESLL